MEEQSPLNRIRHMYDLQPEREWQRAERHRTEFALTLRALERYLSTNVL